MTDFPLIDSEAGLAELVDVLLGVDRYAVDTEFHRERTYYPKLALVQIAWEDQLTLVDPLAVDIAPLAKVLASDATAVMHASGQDLEVLERACGTVPTSLFDTQVAAGFVGMRSPSLAALHDQLLGVRLPKGDRLTDWLQRPLEDRQLRYAAGDVEHLLAIHTSLVDRLEGLERLDWAVAECELVRQRNHGAREPDEAWRRIKEARALRGKAQAAARGVASWREAKAQAIDQPPRYVLSDLAVVALAQRVPSGANDFKGVRGLDERQLKDDDRTAVLEAVAESLDRPMPTAESRPNRVPDRDLRPAVALIAAWLGQYASDRKLDPALVGSRADLEALLRGDDEARLASGWRSELVGRQIRRLVDGDGALAFDGAGRLVLEARSHQEVDLG